MDSVAIAFWGAFFGTVALMLAASLFAFFRSLHRVALTASLSAVVSALFVIAYLGWLPISRPGAGGAAAGARGGRQFGGAGPDAAGDAGTAARAARAAGQAGHGGGGPAGGGRGLGLRADRGAGDQLGLGAGHRRRRLHRVHPQRRAWRPAGLAGRLRRLLHAGGDVGPELDRAGQRAGVLAGARCQRRGGHVLTWPAWRRRCGCATPT